MEILLKYFGHFSCVCTSHVHNFMLITFLVPVSWPKTSHNQALRPHALILGRFNRLFPYAKLGMMEFWKIELIFQNLTLIMFNIFNADRALYNHLGNKTISLFWDKRFLCLCYYSNIPFTLWNDFMILNWPCFSLNGLF